MNLIIKLLIANFFNMPEETQQINNTKKYAIIGGLLIVLILLYFYGSNLVKKDSYHYEMSGNIVEVGENSISIYGPVKSTDPENTNIAHKKVVFNIHSETILTNIVNVITLEQIQAGGTFTPQTESRAGDAQDLKVGKQISKIISQDDLFSKDEADALEIIYTSLEAPIIQ
jgi:hypothetical protein